MTGADHHASTFWTAFSAARRSIEARLAACAPVRGPVPYPILYARFGELIEALAAFDRSLTPEFERMDEGWRFVVSADGALESFAAARQLVAAAPELPGWSVCALRPRRPAPVRVDGPGVSLDFARLRFAYGLANDRMVAMALIDGPTPQDRYEAQFLARRLVADLLGEADYAQWIADTRLVAYEDWLAVTPGGRSWPMTELTARFDAIFHPRPLAPPDLVEAAGAPVAEEDMALCA